MSGRYRFRAGAFLVVSLGWTGLCLAADAPASVDGQTAKAVLDVAQAAGNLLEAGAWRAFGKGFQREGKAFVCDNGSDTKLRRGVCQTIRLDQTEPEPIVATAWSKAEGVTGSPGANYSLYLDLVFQDGTPLWGQSAAFDTGTHDWQQRRVVILPEKPVKSITVNLLLRGHGGKALFRNPELRAVKAPQGACLFDGVPVVVPKKWRVGFQVRDVAAGSDFVHIQREALGLKLEQKETPGNLGTLFDVTLSDTTGKDRAVTLVYAIPIGDRRGYWFHDLRQKLKIEPGREFVNASRFPVGSSGRLSRYPLGAVGNDRGDGIALGIDMARPAFFRIGYNAGTRELFLAYDIALTPEKPTARVRFCRFALASRWGFRAAMDSYYRIFPEAFRCRTPKQGLWMPFAKISQVKGWEDFGFRFKEGTNETKWDDEHGIITFRYTEPMTWWMRMPKKMPRTMEAALAEARRLTDKGDRRAKALLASGYHNSSGQFPARLRDTPWCNGAVWSMNSMPGIAGEVTSFKNKWNPEIREKLYGPKRRSNLDGEYVDSSEGYVTDVLDFRRDHFAATDTPLTFSSDSHKPAIFRGLIAFEYVRGIARDVHRMDKLMMANSTPIRLCWLAPMLEVMGTETDWNRNGRWRPMSDADMLYRRAMCRGKPYCFLMNTRFEDFSHELVEKYMKRSLAYGMFPGFFSHNASQGHYFTRPELYDRDRPLFKKYMPPCKLVAEAGWEPITLARSSDDRVHVERFGRRYLTVLNDSPDERTATIALDGLTPAGATSRELVRGTPVTWRDGTTPVTLAAEDVAVIDLGVRPRSK